MSRTSTGNKQTILAKEEFDSLKDPNISKKSYDTIIGKIDQRFGEIMLLICPSLKHKGWFDYDNCIYDSEESNGYFDLDRYADNIGFGGESAQPPIPFDYEFPTRWLWEEDFMTEFHNEIEKYKKNKLAEKEKRKAKETEKKNSKKK